MILKMMMMMTPDADYDHDRESDDENDDHGPSSLPPSPLPNRQRLGLKSGQALKAASGRQRLQVPAHNV